MLTDEQLAEGRLDMLRQAEDTIGELREELAGKRLVQPEFIAEAGRIRAERDALRAKYDRLREACLRSLSELGVPGPGYPAPVANAVDILNAALAEETTDE